MTAALPEGSIIVWHYIAREPYLAIVKDQHTVRIEAPINGAEHAPLSGWLPLNGSPGSQRNEMFALPPSHPDFDNVWAEHVAGLLDGRWHERMRPFGEKYQGVQS